MFHIFFINVGVLAISSPLFLLLPKTEGYVLSQFFLPFSALCSTLLLEIFLSPHNPLLGAQKAIFDFWSLYCVFVFFVFSGSHSYRDDAVFSSPDCVVCHSVDLFGRGACPCGIFFLRKR
jgi:hypothetical protein